MLLHAFLTLPPLLLLLPLVLVHSYLAASVAADTITIPFNVTAAVKVGGIHFVNKISANQTVFAIQLLTDLGTLTNKDVSSDCMVVIGGLRYHEDKPIIIDNTTASLNTKFTSRHSSVLASNETLNDCDKDTSIPQDRCAFLLQQQCDITMAPPGSPDSCSPLGTRISPKCGFVAKATTKIAGAESQNTAGAGLVENLYADGPAGQTGISTSQFFEGRVFAVIIQRPINDGKDVQMMYGCASYRVTDNGINLSGIPRPTPLLALNPN